jgi:hypothetical protein
VSNILAIEWKRTEVGGRNPKTSTVPIAVIEPIGWVVVLALALCHDGDWVQMSVEKSKYHVCRLTATGWGLYEEMTNFQQWGAFANVLSHNVGGTWSKCGHLVYTWPMLTPSGQVAGAK